MTGVVGSPNKVPNLERLGCCEEIFVKKDLITKNKAFSYVYDSAKTAIQDGVDKGRD